MSNLLRDRPAVLPGLALALVAIASCRSPCDTICDWQAECLGACDYVEDPQCDEEAQMAAVRRDCLEVCAAPGQAGEDSRSAAAVYADCLEGAACGAAGSAECEIAEMRYYELYVSGPGNWVCGYFCGELETGCVAWEKFGYRGNDCIAACEAGAATAACREAHYTLDACTPGSRLACSPDGGGCVAQEAMLLAACDGWVAAEPVPADDEYCSRVAALMCDCGVHIVESGCLELAANQCRFQIGKGQPCINAMDAFSACMEKVPECGRDALRDACEPEWNGWTSACRY